MRELLEAQHELVLCNIVPWNPRVTIFLVTLGNMTCAVQNAH
jgi:hypothetical protein